ncbi:MAG TPA: ATP-grasp domain-containing protein [Mycobacteriales bacterium]|nr:ATP-grasp domain-containing protein [Mycobacteriales bacterium]
MQDFNKQLKNALLGTDEAALVFLGNFEVEEHWARDEIGLPRIALSRGDAVVNRMDEFAILLAGKGDFVVLKGLPDEAYLQYLEKIGVELPNLLICEDSDPHRTVTEDAVASPRLRTTLVGTGAHLYPHGVSGVEEELSAETGLALAAPAAQTCKRVNSKIYSRHLADELGIRQATGWTCETVGEFETAAAEAMALLESGRSIAVKDAFGVSGKGILQIEDAGRLEQIQRKLRRRAERSGDERISVLIEEWVAKTTDLNYQFTIGRDGATRFDFVKEALTRNGVHKGHRIPARLNDQQVEQLESTSADLAGKLAADGYFGVVGVDAMVDPDGGLYPVVEINARNNMSTYQVRLQEQFMRPGQVAIARQYPLRLKSAVPFPEMAGRLDGLLFQQGNGLLINNYATVNAAAGDGDFDGRLYGLLIGDSAEAVEAMDQTIEDRLEGVAQ